MSKVDALRAMREARFASYQAKPAAARPAASETGAPAAAPAKPARRSTAKKVETVELPAAQETDGAAPAAALCGHRNMSGKECSRPAGHAEKNHRYR